MPYSADWYIENEIIYLHYWGETTAEELRESLLKSIALTDSSPRSLVHIMADVGDVKTALNPKKALSIVSEVGAHPRTGWHLILREQSVIVKIGVAFGTSLFKTRNRTFDTLKEAEAFLAEKDTMLTWDKVNKSVIMS